MISAVLVKSGTEVRNSKEVQRMAKCEFCDKGVTFGIQVSQDRKSVV